MSLQAYRKKRDFRKTTEPAAKSDGKSQHRFVIQKHAASRLHYDLRLQVGGTLKSWAVPKGVPYAHSEKRLAVQVEDHPVSYAGFEGQIPKGQYGGGTVMVWDQGTFNPLTKTPAKDLKGGKLHFVLNGTKLQGEWYLVRLKTEDQWLLIRGGEDMKPVSKRQDDTSVVSGKTMKQLAQKESATPQHKRRAPLAFIEPMKAKLTKSPPPGDWLYEIKFDGWRAIAIKDASGVRLLSRTNKDLSAKFPALVEAIPDLKTSEAIVDGEIVALDGKGRSSFQLLQAYGGEASQPPVFFYAFDLLHCDGKGLLSKPLEERKALLETLIPDSSSPIRFSAALGHEAKPLLAQAGKLGLEGLIGKRQQSHYEPGRRTGAWIKLKIENEQEFVIGGYTDPKGSRSAFGSLLLGYYQKGKFLFAGKVGTGFNEKSLTTIHKALRGILRATCPFANLPEKELGRWGQGITLAEFKRCHWVKPTLVCQVKFAEWTTDGKLRHSVFHGLRNEKKAREVIRETT